MLPLGEDEQHLPRSSRSLRRGKRPCSAPRQKLSNALSATSSSSAAPHGRARSFLRAKLDQAVKVSFQSLRGRRTPRCGGRQSNARSIPAWTWGNSHSSKVLGYEQAMYLLERDQQPAGNMSGCSLFGGGLALALLFLPCADKQEQE